MCMWLASCSCTGVEAAAAFEAAAAAFEAAKKVAAAFEAGAEDSSGPTLG